MAAFRTLSDFGNSSEASVTSNPFVDTSELVFEGYEDISSWTPVTIDYFFSNPYSYEGDEKLRSIDIRALPTSSSDPFEFDEPTRSIGGVHGNSLLMAESGSDIYSSPLFRVHDQIHVPTAPKVVQKYHAPLFPVVHMPSHFKTETALEVMVFTINSVLDENRYLSYQFLGSECYWTCSYLHNGSHCRFNIRIYRFPSKSESKGFHAVELHRLEGDGFISRAIYDAIRDAFPDVEQPAAHVFSVKAVSPAAETGTTSTAAEPLLPTSPDSAVSVPPSSSSSLPVPTVDSVKRVLVETLRVGSLSAVVESTQLACDLYGDDDHSPAESIDREVIDELMGLICRSQTCADWACQHAIMAVANMSRMSQYCDILLERGSVHAGDSGENSFLRRILSLAAEGPFSTAGMRSSCVELLSNLVAHNRDSIALELGSESIATWEASPYVRGIQHAKEEAV